MEMRVRKISAPPRRRR